jgi:hypothetical protein
LSEASIRIHVPKPLHGWRSFFGEVGVIVLGVLIALAANAFLDARQWDEKTRAAEESMRLELAEDDGPQAYGRLVVAPCLDAQILRIHDASGHAAADELRKLVSAYNPPFRVWDNEAWKVVLASDVGSHMDPDRLVQWSSPYRLMPGLTDANAKERDVVVDLHEALPPTGEPAAADLQAVRRSSAELRRLNFQFYRASQLILARSRAAGADVSQALRMEMLKEARGYYGSCARPPNLVAPPAAQSLTANLWWLPVRFAS